MHYCLFIYSIVFIFAIFERSSQLLPFLFLFSSFPLYHFLQTALHFTLHSDIPRYDIVENVFFFSSVWMSDNNVIMSTFENHVFSC